MRHHAYANFTLIKSQLFQKPGDELDDPDDAAASQNQKVIMIEAAFAII